ncbi:hypothetical protein A3E39_04615 [Candidatus Uhrbacteria bacterium RIFCSPHIGHO2_12_FULL_60_25]|uniref:Dipeptidylpeptidase IV N-terminal domain-containing protein n=1 Tax=Candidatus Uhrbacteria bacterium RIFCSPHIGHO2_12_FULL_60_25 TaxID=1802399 RepID=A0A1F7UM14_9BACT|nr:MAG: hypothetical protein A3D73_01920 [Candidatus Uhrbacteria bacterium RIFCSPHIGHO2_02_FULL_60_44]OGL79320.1 MAG: hypothetical protein A3E39_04615 [Candidatus Uhrbacteria bacterium RIFCSPHIGHO2_12_FULL_60_25]
MSERLKRILFVVFFILFTIVVAIVIYILFFKPKVAPPGPVEVPVVTPGELPGAGPAVPGVPTVPGVPGVLPPAAGVPGAPAVALPPPQTVLLRDGVTQGVSPSADKTGARFYNPDDGKFYRVKPDGSTTALSDASFPNLDRVDWGKSSDQAIMTFPDGSNIHYDFRTQTQTTLPKHWEDFNFAPDDAQVVAKSNALTPASRYLIVSNPNGGNSQAIELLGNNADKTFPNWTPNNQIIAYATVGEPKGFDRQEILLVGKNHENFRGLQVEGRGFTPLWSPSGKKLLYSVWNAASDYRPELWISGGDPDSINQNRTKLDVQTFANKCVWSTDETVICAVPSSLPTGAGLQPDLFTNIPDSFMQIDLSTGAKTNLGTPAGDLSVRNPVLTEDQAHVIFTDALTGKLYDFNLP